MGQLTTHVLDTSAGQPAAGVTVSLYRDGVLLKQVLTNADGRCDAPLLSGGELTSGAYELVFAIGSYFSNQGIWSPFLRDVPIRFTVQAGESYHVPLVCSPWSYATYRGS